VATGDALVGALATALPVLHEAAAPRAAANANGTAADACRYVDVAERVLYKLGAATSLALVPREDAVTYGHTGLGTSGHADTESSSHRHGPEPLCS
jgi:hypothetical protein